MSVDLRKFFESQIAYKTFRTAYAEKIWEYLIFLGSGPSSVVKSKYEPTKNLPDWKGLIAQLKIEIMSPSFQSNSGRSSIEIIKAVDDESNYWKKMDVICSELHATTFNATIQHALTPDIGSIPANSFYKNIWKFRFRGVATTNVDGIIEQSSGRHINILKKDAAVRSRHIFDSSSQFLLCLHGTLDDPSSYVFTKHQFDELRGHEAYRELMRIVFTKYKVLFYGISFEDDSVTEQLNYLRGLSINTDGNYILLPEGDRAYSAAKDLGIQPIVFPSVLGWDAAFEWILEDINSFCVPERDAQPVLSIQNVQVEEMPAPSELVSLMPDEIRKKLSLVQRSMFETDGLFDLGKYHSFTERYDNAIQLASRVVPGSAENGSWLGRPVISELGKGTFGRVFCAEGVDGSPIAIKIARSEVRDNSTMLDSFRRGVKSMEILTDAGIEGTVRLLSASELPPSLSMEFIQGENFQNFVISRKFESPSDRLRVLIRIFNIIAKCHEHKHSILHRDLRPANIMISGELYESHSVDDLEVTILDFDLSWHLGADGNDYIMTAGDLGYLAPEQLNIASLKTARSQAVDVFGCGMLMYFGLSGKSPVANISMRSRWNDDVYSDIRNVYSRDWRCVRSRLAKIIVAATSPEQQGRPSLRGMIAEVQAIIEILNGREPGVWQFYVDELVHRCVHPSVYNKKTAVWKISSPSGLQIVIKERESDKKIDLEFKYISGGELNRSNVGKFIKDKIAVIKQGILRHVRSDSVKDDEQRGGFSVCAEGVVLASKKDVDSIANLVDVVLPQLANDRS